MILIDTSAWIEFLRKQGRSEIKDRVSLYLEMDEAATTGPVRFELLAGANRSAEADVLALLELCEHIPFEDTYWDDAAGFESELRGKGLTIPRDDLFIATVAMKQGVQIFHADRHFELAASAGLPLKLLTV